MEPGELVAAYVCVGVGGFLLILVIIMLSFLIYTGKCDFCKCEKQEDADPADKVKLKYKVEQEMRSNHSNNSVHTTGSLKYISGGPYVASAYHPKYQSASTHGSSRSGDPPRKAHKREDKYRRVKRVKRSRGNLERNQLRSSGSSQEFSDSKQKAYTLHVTTRSDTVDGNTYAQVNRSGQRYRVVSNGIAGKPRYDDENGERSTTDGSLPASRASSVRYRDNPRSFTHSVPNLMATQNGLILKSPSSSKSDGPIIMRWSPSMRKHTKRVYTSTMPSRSSSRPSSRPFTQGVYQGTPASSRRTVGDFRL